MANWVDEEVEFYDFIWTDPVSACAFCINDAIALDFQEGGTKFETMKLQILKRFPTRESAKQAFKEANG